MIYNTSALGLFIWEKSRLPSTAASTAAALCWSDLLHSAPFPPLFAHDKKVIDSETDTLGCFLAAYLQQSLSSSFRSLSGVMKDRRWNSMAVIATVAPSLPSLIFSMTTQLYLFPTRSGIGPQTGLIPHAPTVSYLRLLLNFNETIVFGDVSATSVNIHGFVLRTQLMLLQLSVDEVIQRR